MKTLLTGIIACFLSLCFVNAQNPDPLRTSDAADQQKWVDSIYNAMTVEERVGQLFMVQAFSNKGEAHEKQIANLITQYHIGGVIFSKGGPVRQAALTNKWQELAKTKLLMAMDAEWGLDMRLDSVFAYPYNMALGAVDDLHLVEAVGKRIGEHCKHLGVHVNFAPVVDVNTNPDNPIIGNRSFGENKVNVAEKALAFTRGMQGAGVLANAKHFPGHGDTESDSHKTLPTIDFSASRIDSVELYPYKRMFAEGLSSVMVAHLNVPSLESRRNLPSSLSENIVTGLLKEKLGFNGLIFTDALGMRGAADYSRSSKVDVLAFQAGNDVLLMSEDVAEGVNQLLRELERGRISEERLAHSVKKILKAKYKVGLHKYSPVDPEALPGNLITPEDKTLYKQVIEHAITLVKNERDLVPVRDLENRKIAYVKFGDGEHHTFLRALQRYARVDHIKAEDLAGLTEALKPYETVIIGHHKDTSTPWKDQDLTDVELTWLHEVARQKDVVLNVFSSPYVLGDLRSEGNFESIVVSYHNDPITQIASAEVVFGAIPARGKLPVSAGKWFPENMGIRTNVLSRLGYSFPEAVGMDSKKLVKIDSVIKRSISSGVTPGAQILVARRGKVIYNKSFGKFDYAADASKVADTNIYDLASLTKILSTLPMIMKLTERGAIDLESTLGELLPELKGSNKADLKLVEVLSHYARLKPWIPFYMYTMDEGSKKPSKDYYRNSAEGDYRIKVADELYLRRDLKDSIFETIVESDLLKYKEYRYSDLPYFLLQRFIEKEYNTGLDKLVQEELYKPMGMNYTTYKPLEKFRKGEIVPSEFDDYYRYQTLQGYVHDMAAAMLGGVGGHAGLFSNANDVAKLMQMYLQKGYYGGDRYFAAQTLDKYNTCYFCDEDNRRGVGFDKPQLGETGPTCGCVSMTSFGHSGFTGTYAWADPDEEIVYVFLSNRTYPSMENRKLITEGTRTVIQELIYGAILD